MSSYEDPHPDKKVTAATTDAPMEEFIHPENVPSNSETEISDETQKDQRAERPRD